MAITDNRVIPLASIRLFDPGAGDPLMLDRGWSKWHALALEDPRLAVNRISRTTGEPTLEILEGCGLVCRPQLILQDTRSTNYTFSGGTWEERRPSSGIRKYRLFQVSTAAPVTEFSATSKSALPKNPNLLLEYLLFDTPPDHDADTYPPYVRFEFGNGVWAIEVSRQFGTRLLKNDDVIAELPEPIQAGGQELGAKTILLRHHRNRIFISTDYGKNYTWHGTDDGEDAEIAASTYVVRGQGGMLLFGLHQVKFISGTYDSPTWNTFTSRGILSSLTLNARKEEPGSTSVTLSDTSAPLAGTASWRATLAPQSIPNTLFTFYQSPELYAVKAQYSVVRGLWLQSYSTPWDDDVLEIDVNKPVILDGASAGVRVFRDAQTQFTSTALRWRKVAILLGEYTDDGASTLTGGFVGYIREVRIPQNEFNKSEIHLEIENATIAAKRQEYDDTNLSPLGGQSLNAALDEVLDSMGFHATQRNWHPLGYLIQLPAGSPEDPAHMPKAGDNKWQVMEGLCRDAGLELFTTDDGIWTTLPIDYVDPYVSHVYDAALSAGDATYSVQGIEFGVDASEAATCVIARGKDEFNNPIWAFGVDTEAEGNPLSAKFAPWREVVSVNVPGTTTIGWLALIVQSRFRDEVGLKFEGDAHVPVKLGVLRRQRIQIQNTTVGINNYDTLAVMSLRHSYRSQIAHCATTAGVRRL